MSPLSFIFYTILVVVVGIFIRLFWLELYIIWNILKALVWITVGSLVSAIIWVIWIKGNTSGELDSSFKLCWTFFFITYSVFLGVMCCIMYDLTGYATGLLRYFLRKN